MEKAAGKPDFEKMTPEQFEKFGITKEELIKITQFAKEREKRVPPIGSMAPDFEINYLSTKGKLTEERVKLSALRGRPVALIFGSYT